MADNVHASPVSQTRVSESFKYTPVILTPVLSTGPSMMGRPNLTNTNNSRLVPTPPPLQLQPRQHPIVEDQTPPSSKRPRGRPLGSKNKGKQPITVTKETDTQPIVIQIPDGHDIIESLINLAKTRQASISVLASSGIVREVTLRNAVVSSSATYSMQGPFLLISLFGTYVNEECGRVPPECITNPPSFSFTIYLADAYKGYAFGGGVGGKIIASGVVTITVGLINKQKFLRVDIANGNIEEFDQEEDDPRRAAGAGGVIINADRSAAAAAIEPNNNNGNNTNIIGGSMGFGAAATAGGENVTPPHLLRQLSPFPTDVNIMRGIHHTRSDNY